MSRDIERIPFVKTVKKRAAAYFFIQPLLLYQASALL